VLANIDPFSLATGIAGIISLTTPVSKLAEQYGHGVQKSSKGAEELSQALDPLLLGFEQMEKFLKHR